ncbi:MAG TPA: hypothetical protein VGE98_08280 [Thermoanaerobaculia bacterium]
MTDSDLVAKKLAAIETALREVRTLGRVEALRDDVKDKLLARC